MPLYKQLKKNLLQGEQTGPCRVNPSCHKVRAVKGSQTSVIQQQSTTLHSSVSCFVLHFNNLHCGVSVVIKMGLGLFIFIRVFQSTMALYASATLMPPSFMQEAEKPTALRLKDFCQKEPLSRINLIRAIFYSCV